MNAPIPARLRTGDVVARIAGACKTSDAYDGDVGMFEVADTLGMLDAPVCMPAGSLLSQEYSGPIKGTYGAQRAFWRE